MASDVVAEIRDRTDIVGLVAGYVPLKKAGRNFKGLCPFHQEKTPSFIVFPESGNFKCFGCGKGGDVFTFYKEVERVEFREALEELARRAGIELRSAPPPSPERDAHRQKLIELNELAATFYSTQLRTSPSESPASHLVESRGLSPEIIEQFQIGAAPDAWDKLAQFMAARGIDPDRALEVGLLTERQSGGYYDRFRNRLIFPIRDRDGHVVGFGGRAFGDEQPKYLNTPQTELFDKSNVLYGLDRARDDIRRVDQAVVVEGYMDVLAAHQFGYRNVVASMGTAIAEAQLGLLKRFTRNVVLALDADTAGQTAMVRALEALPTGESESAPVAGRDLIFFEKRLSVNINVLALPTGKDPDEMIRADPDSWPKVVTDAQPFLGFYIDRITADVDTADPRQKDAAVHRAAALLSLLPDGVEIRHYVEILAGKLRMADRQPIADAIRQARKRNSIVAPPLPSPPVPRQSRVEDHLVALILEYPSVLAQFAAELEPNELTDARNRELVILVAATATTGEPPAVPGDHLQMQRDHLASLLADRTPMNRIDVLREAQRTLEKLRHDQIKHSISELQIDIAAAERDNDQETVVLMLTVLNQLAAAKQSSPPRKSPVFEDSRDWKAARKSKIKLADTSS
jgi:DNA primase